MIPFDTPDGVTGNSGTRVLLAVLDGHTTYSDLIRATGLGRATVHKHLERLRDRGLVTWERGRMGTLRPCVVPTSHQ